MLGGDTGWATMRTSEQKIEWLFVNLRWFLLLVVAGIVGIHAGLTDAPFPRQAFLLLTIGATANLAALIGFLRNPNAHGIQQGLLVLDVALTLGFLALDRDIRNQLLFVSLIPIITAAVRYPWIVSTAMTVGIVAAYWGISWLEARPMYTPPSQLTLFEFLPAVITGVVLLAAGGAVALVGSRIKTALIAEQEERDRRTRAALRKEQRRTKLIFELASTLSATLNYERVLDAVLEVSHIGVEQLFGETRGQSQVSMILLHGIDGRLYVAKGKGLSPQEREIRFTAMKGVLARALSQSKPVVTGNPASDPELGRIYRFRESAQAIVVPLRAGYENFGLLVLGSSEPDSYTTDMQELLLAICNQAVLALQNASLYQNLMEEKDRLVTVEEDARKKLARDLHDGPTQTIAAIAMRLNYLRLLVAKDPQEVLMELKQLEEMARRTTKEIRQMLFTLRPLILESQGLLPAIRQLVKKLREITPAEIHLEANPEVEQLLNHEAKGALFYIIDEALANARKHAEAHNLWIRLYPRSLNIVAEIEDDGKGFDVAAMEAEYATRDSLGLLNLRERAKLVGGRTVIASKPGEGTRVTVTIPVSISMEEQQLEPDGRKQAQ